ncbi:MAG TPA: sugar phosphate isomerase/epimerase [Clostridia bacterium]|nr:sugar phosphate isomerase/epimerase [Clostridia bacterium]
MKYGIYYAFWEKQWGADYTKYIQKAALLGFDILELSCASLDQISKKEVEKLKAAKNSYGLKLTAGYGPKPSQNIASSDPVVVKNALDFWNKVFQVLYALDINTVGGGLYYYWPVDYTKPIDKQKDWESSVKGVRQLADLASDFGINICMEALNRHEGFLINTATECVDFVNQTERKNVKVMLDTYHMNMEEDDMSEAILSTKGLLGHFHVGENNRRLPGQGTIVDWKKIGKALKEINYNDAVVMEPFVLMGGKVGSDIKIWRDLSNQATEEMMDLQAKESLAFLKKIFD